MNVSELEQRVGELNERLTRAYDDLDQVRKEHGLSPDDVFVLPTVPPEMIDASPKLRAVAEERARKLKACLMTLKWLSLVPVTSVTCCSTLKSSLRSFSCKSVAPSLKSRPGPD